MVVMYNVEAKKPPWMFHWRHWEDAIVLLVEPSDTARFIEMVEIIYPIHCCFTTHLPQFPQRSTASQLFSWQRPKAQLGLKPENQKKMPCESQVSAYLQSTISIWKETLTISSYIENTFPTPLWRHWEDVIVLFVEASDASQVRVRILRAYPVTKFPQSPSLV